MFLTLDNEIMNELEYFFNDAILHYEKCKYRQKTLQTSDCRVDFLTVVSTTGDFLA